MKKEMICIGCPLGCNLSVEINDEDIAVTGNNCPNGERYAKNEIANPVRILTSTIETTNGKRVSCKTSIAIPKPLLFKCMEDIKHAKADVPVKIGDVLIKNIEGTGADIIATSNVK